MVISRRCNDRDAPMGLTLAESDTEFSPMSGYYGVKMAQDDILNVMEPGKIYTVREIYKMVDDSSLRPSSMDTVRRTLSKLYLKGSIDRVGIGRYMKPAEKDDKEDPGI